MYDVAIIGGGMAGLTAAIYSVRYGLKTIVISTLFGGAITEAPEVENWPGENNISGFELMNKIKKQAEKLGVETLNTTIKQIKKEKNIILKTEKKKIEAKTLILATGTERRKLNLKNEDKLVGKGVSYCATCDSMFYQDKNVAVIGGGNAAIISVLVLAKIAKKIYWIIREEKPVGEKIRIKQIKENKKVEIITNSEVKELIGETKLESIKLSNNQEIKLDGLFIEIGSIPLTNLAKELNLKLNKNNQIITDEYQRTNIENIFAAGDVTSHHFKQLTTAAAQGSIAAFSANIYLNKSN